MTNRYGNPTVARFYNNGYLAVDRDTSSGKFVSKVKPSVSTDMTVEYQVFS